MEIILTDKNLTELEKNEIEKLLAREGKNTPNDLEQMWYLMDLVWDDFRCDNKNLNWENIVTTTLIKKYLKKNKNSFLNKLMNKINTLWRNK